MRAMQLEARFLCAVGALVLALLMSRPSLADSGYPIEVKATAAVRHDAGGRAQQLIPADLVVPGDEVFYTLEIKNTGSTPLPTPTVDFAIPEHMRYVANSAVGAGAEVSYSIDGGHTFGRPESLMIAADGGELRPATAAEYTHIRWRLKHVLKAKAMALARFRAVVK
jgi:uncharacterized repeat protein (TIGR01451 family)